MTRDLVRIPSVWRPDDDPPGTERDAAAYVRDELSRLGAAVEWHEVDAGRPLVIGRFDFGDGPTLLMEGHTDTVTAGDPAAWQHDPFGAVIADGRIHGRGTIDTKGNVAAALVAARHLAARASDLRGRLVLLFPCDEEDRMLGVKAFVAMGGTTGVDAAIICEPEENHVCVTQKGAMRWAVTFHGRMAHGAMPYAGINPIPAVADLLAAVAELEEKERGERGEDLLLGWPSLTPTVLRAPAVGEPQLNVIPDSCLVGVDVRTIPGQSHERLVADLQRALDAIGTRHAPVEVRFQLVDDRPWTETPRDVTIVRCVADAVRTVTGREPIYDGVPGTTDGTYLHLAGVPIVTIGAGSRTLPHQANEYVEIDELVETVRIYETAAASFLGAAA